MKGTQFASRDDEDSAETKSLRQELDALRASLREMEAEGGELRAAVARAERELERVLAEREEHYARQQANLAKAQHALHLVTASTSWRLTRPIRVARTEALRVLKRVGREVHGRLPLRLRAPVAAWSYRNLAPLLKGLSEYEPSMEGAWIPDDGTLIDATAIAPALSVDGSIAIQLHMYYHDLADEFAGYLRNMPFDYDLYVSVASDEGARHCRAQFAGLPRCRSLCIEVVPNRGRDLAPFFCTFGERLSRYDYVAHLHSKKSLYNQGATEGWRQYLCGGLLGSEERIRKIFTLLEGEASCGIVYPQNSALLPYAAHCWLANKDLGSRWCERLGLRSPRGYFDFPAGSMFWAKGDGLRPLFEAGITLEDFAPEAGQTDGTFAHCLERLLGLSPRKHGYRVGVLRDEQHPSWSPWRFDQYLARTPDFTLKQMADGAIRLIAFDIFDTLLCRPLLDPESVKRIVAERVGGREGALYLAHRALAEAEARQAAGRDVGMDAIFARLGARAGLDETTVARLRHHEETVERASLVPRAEGVDLYRRALGLGKPVVLISDMFLPRALVETCLREHGIDGWSALYLSNEVGLRKDTGALYDHVLAAHGITAKQLWMCGDNERSDVQIPGDRGATVSHVLRPLELARGLPRSRRLVEQQESSGDLAGELSLGLVLRRGYSDLFHPRLDPSAFLEPTPFNLGYAVVGPLLTSFAEWLLCTAVEDRVDRLYFVAREGQLMKQVYERWAAGRDAAPALEYLVISRRAVSVPALERRADVLDIAKATYFSNTIESFLATRYGLTLGDARWSELSRQMGWRRGRKLHVYRRRIEQLVPLLEALEPEIFAQAAAERPALMVYLDQVGLSGAHRPALLDVGYGGTIQRHLVRLLGKPVQGYYMMTDERAKQVAVTHDVLARGCFLEEVPLSEGAPLMYRHNFALEKLLSSDDAQIIRYHLDGQTPVAEHYPLSEQERAWRASRAELREGVMAYVADALDVRARLLPSFAPSRAVARQIYEAFVTNTSAGEEQALRGIVLDDHYCGRGLVR